MARTASRKIKAVIFDLDGTLADAYLAIIHSFSCVMRSLKLPLQSHQTIRRAVGWGDRNLLKPFVPSKDLDRALQIYRRDHERALQGKTRCLPGARNILRLLKRQGYKIALASNRPTKFSHIILEYLKIKKYFNYVLCGDKITKAKPSPDILLAILKRLSLKSSEAVYVGDMTIDVVAGKRAKMKVIAVATGSNMARELQKLKPFKVIKNMTQLNPVLSSINNSST